MEPLIISFFTSDWEYPEHAQRLESECRSLAIDSHIVEIESTGSYRKNCSKKPRFILEALEKFQRPLLWLDVDASIIRYPSALMTKDVLSYDIAAVRKKPQFDFWYVNSLWFNYTPRTSAFVELWCQAANNVADDGAFQAVYAKNKSNISLLALDPAMHMILSKDRSALDDDICFVHRTSRGQSKQEERLLSRKLSQEKKNAIT